MTADEIKKLMASSDFYDRFDKEKNWDFLGVMAGRAMQSAEFNEIQHIAEEKIKALGNSLYAEGTIIESCSISYDPSTKKANLDGGRVFLDGLIYEIAAAALNIPDTENIQVGIWKKSKCVTEYEDDSLLDPAKGTPQYQMPGGYRIVTKAEWGLSNEDIDMPFFPVYGHMYRTVYKKPEVRKWQNETIKYMRECWKKKPAIRAPLELRIEFTSKYHRKWDIDNRIKPLQDCLERAGIIENDRQIESLYVMRKYGSENRTRIILQEYVNEEG